MYTKNVDLTQDITEALSWSLLKKSVSGEDLTTLETSTTSASSSADSDDLKLCNNVKTFTSNNKHFNTSLVTPTNK